MSETDELLRICELLGISGAATSGDGGHKTSNNNLELIRSILNTLNKDTSSQRGQPACLSIQALPDSLAFPAETRGKNRNTLASFELWEYLRNFNDSLKLDYSARRQMLLNRLHCTVESFKWKAAGNPKKSLPAPDTKTNDLIHKRYENAMVRLKEEPNVSISHLLAARETDCDIVLNSITSSCNTDCKFAYKSDPRGLSELVYLKRVIIPTVPDRGGRTGEIRAPAKETISQQYRDRGRRRPR